MRDYDGYNFEKFKELAMNKSISDYEKIGFPDSYRKGKGEEIVSDICSKIPIFTSKKNLNVLDIGPGCSDVQGMISDICVKQNHTLFLADSSEMLSLIGTNRNAIKIPGFFPDTSNEIMRISRGIDVIICYSVFHYLFAESNMWEFIDTILSMLNDGAQVIIGDVPNNSKRKRFFSSENGIKFHQNFMKTDSIPNVQFNHLDAGKIDDSVFLSIIMRCQLAGFDAYVVPQSASLPFYNRRDDIIIRKP